MDMLARLFRYIQRPWRGYFPRGWRVDRQTKSERFWADVCGPLGDPNASARLFPNVSHPFQACRVHHKGIFERRMPLACEPVHTDQSVFNNFFRR